MLNELFFLITILFQLVLHYHVNILRHFRAINQLFGYNLNVISGSPKGHHSQ